MIGIVDYGVGNLASIRNMLHRINVQSVVSSDRKTLANADALILPGVGAFDTGISNLRGSGLWDLLNERALVERTPILGICLGAQLLTEGSDEGELPGLGWIKGRTVAFDTSRFGAEHKVPNMGWRNVFITRPNTVCSQLPSEPRFYFVHSYHLRCVDPTDEIISCDYGYSFTAGVQRDNIVGVQFHPEKSHRFGMSLLAGFADWVTSIERKKSTI